MSAFSRVLEVEGGSGSGAGTSGLLPEPISVVCGACCDEGTGNVHPSRALFAIESVELRELLCC